MPLFVAGREFDEEIDEALNEEDDTLEEDDTWDEDEDEDEWGDDEFYEDEDEQPEEPGSAPDAA